VTVHDEIWAGVPEDRPLDPHALELAVAEAGAEGLRVLDLGCGDGRLAAELDRAGARVTGLDPSEVALERARRAHPGLELARPAPDGSLPFADSSFDAVVCAHVLEHVADTQRLMSEARRVLAPSGRIMIAVPWHGRLKNVAIALGSFERHHDPLEPVVRFYTAASLRRLLSGFGFDEVSVRGAGGAPFFRETLLGRARRRSLVSPR
jgi:ubiquinone/menaquinone biosynthesis C-methylase UbiE